MYKLLVDQKLIFRIIRHALLFFAMVLLFSWVAHSRSDTEGGFLDDFLMVFNNAIVFFGYAYLTVYFLIPHILVKKKVFLFLFLFFLSGLALSGLKFLFSDYLFYLAISPENASRGPSLTLSTMLVNTKDMTFIVAIFAIVKYARDHYILESNIRELQQKGLEAEIKLLEHHMDPHVIFNNFNSLYSISLNRPEYLKTTVKKLRSVLHYLFRESKLEKVSLSREIEMIENYIGLEKLRYGERLKISYDNEGSSQGLEIAPLILYPFVENCFVHGAGEDPDQSWIRINLSVRSICLLLNQNCGSMRPIRFRKTKGRNGPGIRKGGTRTASGGSRYSIPITTG
ncbi:MAG: histidine kinase [Bacteroidales bacterium]|nr:histidine kinase [Bacteroidales bacterium]